MPESESKPKLIELIGPGTGQGWKAVLRNGKPAVVHEIPVPPAEATAAVPRLQRLFEHRHPALSPVLAWGTDQNGVWVAVEPNEGTPLSSILARGPLTPPAAAALGAAVLSGVAALHEAGIAMGGFGATPVRVTNNGQVRLAGHPDTAGAAGCALACSSAGPVHRPPAPRRDSGARPRVLRRAGPPPADLSVDARGHVPAGSDSHGAHGPGRVGAAGRRAPAQPTACPYLVGGPGTPLLALRCARHDQCFGP